MVLCIITGILGFICGLVGMAILASSSQAGMIEKEYAMRNTLLKVLKWNDADRRADFPENDIRDAITID